MTTQQAYIKGFVKRATESGYTAAEGFEPSLIAIPEARQDRFESFRHPENLLHLHSHNDHWTMHEDEHPSLSMALRGASLREMPKAVASGLSHVLTEGVPGAYKYVANRINRSGGMLDAVKREARMGGVKQANHNDAPTLKQINDYYKGIVHALN
jgi:hypothetical protein